MAQDIFDSKRIIEWSKNVEESITKVFKNVDSYIDYKSFGLTAQFLNDEEVIKLRNDALAKLKSIVKKKQQIVNAITVKVEESYLEFTKLENKSYFVPYIKAKNVQRNYTQVTNCSVPSYIELSPDSRFWDIQTNRHQSTVHIPTNVYDCSKSVQNVSIWTQDLDSVFIKNQNSIDKTVKWQYFASQTGFFKIFPGIEWQIPVALKSSDSIHSVPVDFFDCRNQEWYIQAAAYPKDVIILIDSSGSMKGRGRIIANDTVSKILSTLSDNDFFNIVMMCTDPKRPQLNTSILYVDTSYNQTMIQATEINKDRTMQKLAIRPAGMADYEKGFVESFKLLRLAKEARNYTWSYNGDVDTANCNQAIMVLTDGIPEKYTELLNRLNPEKDVRIFTYLIGQEAADLENINAISCNNRGYSVRISTLADVRESVQKYLPVIARSNAIKDHHFFVWTGVHSNQIEAKGSSDDAMLELFTSVAQAVYDRSEKLLNVSSGVLLGVAGVDVPIKDFVRVLPDYKLGVFAYFFCITNNGYVLFHPEFKPTYFQYVNSEKRHSLRPYFKSVDISTLEFPADDVLENGKLVESQLDELKQAKELRENMISSIEGVSSMLRKFMISENRRSYQQNMKYFFAKLISPEAQNSNHVDKTDAVATPFSIAVAFPWSNSAGTADIKQLIYPNRIELESFVTEDDLKLKLDFCLNSPSFDCKGYHHTISNYEFCEFFSESHATMFKNRSLQLLLEVMTLSKAERSALNCDEEYLQRIFTDAEMSKNFRITSDKELNSNSLGIKFMFFVSNTGLVRWNQRENLTISDKEFITELRQATRGEHYRRTANLNRQFPNMLVFTGPTDATVNTPERVKAFEDARPYNLTELIPELSITATRVLHLTQENGNADVLSPVGMLGYRVPYNSFRKMFLEDANVCSDTNTCLNCSLESVSCYLVDNDAYVVVSKKSSDIGKPFDAVQCEVTQDLIKKEIFESTIGFDFQAICKYSPTRPKSASRLLDPISWIVNVIFGFLYHSILLFAELSLTSVYNAVFAEDVVAVSYDGAIFSPIQSDTQQIQNMDEATLKQNVKSKSSRPQQQQQAITDATEVEQSYYEQLLNSKNEIHSLVFTPAERNKDMEKMATDMRSEACTVSEREQCVAFCKALRRVANDVWTKLTECRSMMSIVIDDVKCTRKYDGLRLQLGEASGGLKKCASSSIQEQDNLCRGLLSKCHFCSQEASKHCSPKSFCVVREDAKSAATDEFNSIPVVDQLKSKDSEQKPPVDCKKTCRTVDRQWIAQRLASTNLLLIAVDLGNAACLSCENTCNKVVQRFDIEPKENNDTTFTRWTAFRNKPPWGCFQVPQILENATDCKFSAGQIKPPILWLTFGWPLLSLISSFIREKYT